MVTVYCSNWNADASWRCLYLFMVCVSDCDGRMITTIRQLDELRQQNCTVIVGPLIIQGLESDDSEYRPSLDTVRQITQFLVIQRLGGHYTSINQLLPNLAVIRGSQKLDNTWALAIVDNPFLTDTGWSPLPVIRKGEALVLNSPQLSRQTILSLVNSLPDVRRSLVTSGLSLRNRSDSCEFRCADGDRACKETSEKCKLGKARFLPFNFVMQTKTFALRVISTRPYSLQYNRE